MKKRSQDRHKPSRMLRIPLSLYEELERLAEQNVRPIHWEARIAIENHLRDAKKKPPKEED